MRLVLIAALTIAACKDKPKPDDPPVAAKDAAPEPAPEPIAEARAKKLLADWLAAQNGGGFDAYEALYAARLVGVKRAGKRVSRFDRQGWLADRKRMFRKKMVVEASDTRIATTPNTATIAFTQRWASGSYEDVGPKRLLAVLEGGALKIAREEMLESRKVDASKAVAGDVSLVWDIDGAAHLILDTAVPATTGEARAGGGKDDVIGTVAAVADGDLAPGVVGLRGESFRVGASCEARVTGFAVHSRVVPHFGVIETWKQDKTSEAQKLAEAFAAGTQVVVARLDGCAGQGRYATPLASKPPVIGAKVDDRKLVGRALAEFATFPEAIKLQAEWEADGNTGSWLDKSDGAVEVFKHPTSGQTLVSVPASAGDGCGGDEFHARVWMVFEVKGGKLEAGIIAAEPPGKILEAVDIDGDGTLELLIEGSFGSGVDLELILDDGESIQLGHAFNDTTC